MPERFFLASILVHQVRSVALALPMLTARFSVSLNDSGWCLFCLFLFLLFAVFGDDRQNVRIPRP
ncbi:hypothetical protein ALP66_03599, partial [Pseudomonas amygdali pv. photiniae]